LAEPPVVTIGPGSELVEKLGIPIDRLVDWLVEGDDFFDAAHLMVEAVHERRNVA
jgi:hypothetical protein